MKRLLCIVGKMNVGGAETFLMKIYRKLDRTQYQMDFAVAAPGKGTYEDEIIALGGRIHHITPKSKGPIKNFNSIKKLVRENHYEYVIRISQHSLSALELLAAKAGGAKRCIFRSSNSNTTSTSRLNNILHRVCMFMPRQFADARFAPSTEAAEFMFGKGCVEKGTAVLLLNAVDLDVYRYDKAAREEIRREFGIGEQFVVGHVGRFNAQKNHSFLIDSFEEIMKNIPDAVLILIGKGELEEEIKKKAAEQGLRVIFAGVRLDVPRILSAMDVFLFPSLYEGMPNTVIEAQAAGLPCVIADTITREADITGLVTYMSLGAPAEEWAEAVLSQAGRERIDTKEIFVRRKYDIQSAADEFISLVFRKKG